MELIYASWEIDMMEQHCFRDLYLEEHICGFGNRHDFNLSYICPSESCNSAGSLHYNIEVILYMVGTVFELFLL